MSISQMRKLGLERTSARPPAWEGVTASNVKLSGACSQLLQCNAFAEPDGLGEKTKASWQRLCTSGSSSVKWANNNNNPYLRAL